jgi:AraC-like DNA-binding protein
MHSRFARLLDLWTLKPGGYPIAAKAALLPMISSLLRRGQTAGAADGGAGRAAVEAAQEFIAANYGRDLTPARIARHVGLSESYLFALFRRHLRRSPMRCVAEERLRRAAGMLARGGSVTATAYEVGFSSVHYFSRAFRKRFGRPPSAFARQFRRR